MTLIFQVFGLTIAIDKTQIVAYIVSEDVMSSKSPISIRNQRNENVRSFKYLGNVLCNDPSNSSVF